MNTRLPRRLNEGLRSGSNAVPTPGDPAKPVGVERKKPSYSGDQGTEFREVLAIAYSSTARDIKHLAPIPGASSYG